jgi:alpha-tubulin suppressor-like RCC1 family protein
MYRAFVRPIAAALGVIFVSACHDGANGPTAPEVGPDFGISDANHTAGNPHFAWLPPMADASTPAGTFDPIVDPEVSICEWNGLTCVGDPVVTFTRHTGQGSELLRVELGEAQYIVDWHTDRYPIDPAKIYRISVTVGSTVLGFADVQVAATGRSLKNVDTDQYLPLVDGRTLPIKFRIEEGAIPTGAPGPVVLGFYHSCFLAVGGQAWCSGNNFYGQLGTGSAGDNSAAPVQAAVGHAFVELALGLWHTCGRKADGSVWCWGYSGANATGPTPPPSGIRHLAPVRVTGIPSAARLVAGYEHTCILSDAGEAWCWGANFNGQLGRGFTSFPGEAPARTGTAVYADLGAAYLDTCGRTAAGQIQCWGYNGFGEHGDNSFTVHPSPTPALGTHASLYVGTGVTCSLDADGAASCWGDNAQGALGRGPASGTFRTPQPVTTALRFSTIAPASSHTCAITIADSAAYCWGSGWALGTGSLLNAPVPGAPVTGSRTWAAIQTNDFATCAVTTSGVPYCWGQGSSGELGTGSFAFSQPNPTPVVGGHVVAAE